MTQYTNPWIMKVEFSFKPPTQNPIIPNPRFKISIHLPTENTFFAGKSPKGFYTYMWNARSQFSKYGILYFPFLKNQLTNYILEQSQQTDSFGVYQRTQARRSKSSRLCPCSVIRFLQPATFCHESEPGLPPTIFFRQSGQCKSLRRENT